MSQSSPTTSNELAAPLDTTKLYVGVVEEYVIARNPGAVPHRAPTAADVRAWAVTAGMMVSDHGRIAAEVMRAYLSAHGTA